MKYSFFGKIGLMMMLIATFFWFISTSSALTLQDGLVANWTFDNCTATDDTSHTNDGWIVWNPQCVDGIKSKALKFDGYYNPDYVLIPNSTDLSFIDNFTLSLWFNIQSNTSMDGWGSSNEYGRQVLLAKSWDREGLEIGLWRHADDGLWYPNLMNGQCCTSAGRSIEAAKWFDVWLNSWHLVTATFGNGIVKLFVDWKLAAQQTVSEFNVNPWMIYRNLQLSIGQSSWWYPFNGIMDDIRVYNRALPNEEIKGLHDALIVPPLSLLSSTPTDGAIEIPTNSIFWLTFSSPLDQSTVPGNISLEKTGMQSIATVAISYTGGTIAFHAISPLEKDTSYTIRIKTGLKDTDGNGFGEEKTISFTTEKALVAPTGLLQQIQSPLLEKEKVGTGSKIWKYQSGSGIILSATNNASWDGIKLDFEVYKIDNTTPSYTFSTGGTTIVVPFLWAWEYSWRIRASNESWNVSPWVDFWTDSPQEIDYELYEWFEPYPYGYRFANNRLAIGLLNGWIDTTWNGVKYKIDWNRWDIFNKAYPEYLFKNKDAMFDIFDLIWMGDNKPFRWWNCFWMALSAAMQYEQPFYMNEKFYDFYLQVHTWSIWSNIEPIKTSYWTDRWDEYNTTLETILTFQLYQTSSGYSNAQAHSKKTLSATWILEKLKNNPDKTYILTFDWEVDWVKESHAVVPYKVEGNKIYIWDNNIQYPKNKYWKSYEQFIQVNNDGTWSDSLYKWKFTEIYLIDVRDIDYSHLGLPDWFNINDTLITSSGNSDMYLTDSSWKITGYKDGNIYEEISWAYIVAQSSVTLSWATENTWKQIYMPQKRDGLTIRVVGKTEEKYKLMIAWWDYYTKVEWVTTSTGQTDSYSITWTGIIIDFDNQKTGTYTLLTDNFQNSLTGTVFLSWVVVIPEPQRFTYDWSGILQNTSDAITYQVDSDNDGNYDISSNFSSVPKSVNEKWNISWYVKWDANTNMAGWKICVDKNKNGTCEENSEIFTTTDNKWYYKFVNLDKWSFSILEIPHQNWSIAKPASNRYKFILNNGQNVKDLNFENTFTKWKGK